MSAPDLTERGRLAAEHALRLLDGEDALKARGFMASDPEFAAEVAAWETRLAPLMDEVAPIEPGPELWARIERASAAAAENTQGGGGQVVALKQRLRRWQWATGITAAAAALAIAFLAGPLMQSPAGPVAPDAAQNPLVASIPIADTPLRIGVTYLPDRSELLVSASGLSADGVHDHELWLVPPSGAPQSLGVVVPGEERRVPVDRALAERIGDGSDLILTREPLGGAPAGGDAGPVVASGAFSAV